jgi:5-formyltetrahydrofolate cyclo-ligase
MSIKEYLRSELKARRREYYQKLSASDITEIESKLIEKVFSLPIPLAPSQPIACYYAIKDEVPTSRLITEFWRRGFHVGLPRIHEDLTLSFHVYHQGDQVETSMFSIPQPSLTSPSLHPNIIFTPMLGFNRDGHRIGYGLGHYDRVLQAIRLKRPLIAVGLAFDCQEVNDIFAEEFDEGLDWIVTESEIIKSSV